MRTLPMYLGSTVALVAAPLLLVGSAGASTPQALVPYGSDGWSYLEVSAGGVPAGFEDPSFDDSTWSVGQAPFGTTSQDCPVNTEVATAWGPGTELLLRKDFTLPPGATDLTVGLAIDNDVTAYLNGVEIGGGPHQHCATYDSMVLPVDDALLRTGENTLAVRASDHGVLSFFDAQVSFVDGPAHTVCGPRGRGHGSGLGKAHKARRAGSTLPIKLRLCDAAGANVSRRGLVVHATSLQTTDGNQSAPVKGSGAANSRPLNDFRFGSARSGYVFNLSTKGLDEGTWQLSFTVDGEADDSYAVQFRIRG